MSPQKVNGEYSEAYKGGEDNGKLKNNTKERRGYENLGYELVYIPKVRDTKVGIRLRYELDSEIHDTEAVREATDKQQHRKRNEIENKPTLVRKESPTKEAEDLPKGERNGQDDGRKESRVHREL